MINLQVLYVAADPFSGSSQIPFLFWKQNICHHACFLILLLWSLLTLNYSFFLVLIFVLFLITSACHFKKQNDHDNSFLMHAQLLISRKTNRQSIRQYTSYSSVLSPLHCVINGEQHEKHLCNQSSHYGKYGIFNHQSTCSSYQSKRYGVLLDHAVSLRFVFSYFEHFE